MSNELEILKRCKKDPAFYISNFCKVVHPMRGLVPFQLYNFQKKIVSSIEDFRFNILKKFRQAGCTTLAAAYTLWFCSFNPHKIVTIISKDDAASQEVLERVKIMWTELPDFLQQPILEDNKHTFRFKNGSIIRSKASSKEAGRSIAGSLLIVDEAAFIENIKTIWTAAYPILSTGGRALIISTVNGMGNWFHDQVIKAQEGKSRFHYIDIKWQDHPEYFRHSGYEHLYEEMEARIPPLHIDDWETITRSNLSPKEWLQEYEGAFLGTGDTYIDGQVLQQILDKVNDEYYKRYNNRMRIWEDPSPYCEYVIGVDTALGTNRDHSAFHVINCYNGEQVAEFYSNRTPVNEYAKILYEVGNLYNTASICVERNSIGLNLIENLFEIQEYENVWEDETGTMGVLVTNKNRDNLLSDMEEYIRLSKVKLNSKRTVKELTTFIVDDNNKSKADEGQYDDLVMSLALSINVFKNVRSSSIIEHIEKSNEVNEPIGISKSYKYNLATNGVPHQEEITWLLGR